MILFKPKGRLIPLNSEFMISGTGMVQSSQPTVQNIPSPQKKLKQTRVLTRIDKLPSLVQEQVKITEQPYMKSVQKKKQSLKPIKKKVIKKPKTPPEPVYVISQAPIERREVSPVIIRTAPVKGQLMIKYSHYKDYFCIVDGVLREDVVKEQYCLSTIFKGDYRLKLRLDKDPDKKYITQPEKGAWYGLESGKVYILEIDEDQIEIENKNYSSLIPYKSDEENFQRNRVDQINLQLKSMSLEEINYKQVQEPRNIEELYFK